MICDRPSWYNFCKVLPVWLKSAYRHDDDLLHYLPKRPKKFEQLEELDRAELEEQLEEFASGNPRVNEYYKARGAYQVTEVAADVKQHDYRWTLSGKKWHYLGP